jgi:O-antigen ligase
MLADHPLFGVGLDNFLYYYPDYIRPEAAAEPNLSHPHNVLLDFWARLGMAGIALLVWLVYAVIYRGLKAWEQMASAAERLGDEVPMMLGLLAGVVAMLAHGLVDQSYFTIELAFTFALTSGWLSRTSSWLGDTE